MRKLIYILILLNTIALLCSMAIGLLIATLYFLGIIVVLMVLLTMVPDGRAAYCVYHYTEDGKVHLATREIFPTYQAAYDYSLTVPTNLGAYVKKEV